VDLPRPLPRIDTDGEKPPSLRELARTAAQETERTLIEEALVKTRWNRREAAKILRISYRALRYKIQAYGLGNRASNGNRRGVAE
jgi:two-component system response regulator AtoC